MKFFASLPPPPRPPRRPPAPPRLRRRPAGLRSHPADIVRLAPTLVGQWSEPGSADSMEFLANGMLFERLATGEVIQGSYELKGARLRIELDGMEEALRFTVGLTREELELTDPEGQATRYRRL